MRYKEFLESVTKPASTEKPQFPTEKALLRMIAKNSFKAAHIVKDMIAAGHHVSHMIMAAMISEYGYHIELFPHASEDLQVMAVSNCAEAIKLIEHPSDEVQAIAIQKDPAVLRFILHPGHSACMAAVSAHGHLVKYVPHPDPLIQLAAIRQSFGAIEGIEHCCEEAQILAAEKYGAGALQAIRNDVSEAAVVASIKKEPSKTVALFATLPVELQHLAYETDRHAIHSLLKLANLDPELARIHHRHQRVADREYKLPLLKKGPQTRGIQQDQLKLLRWMDLHHTDEISVKELKKQPWGNTPYFMALVQKTRGQTIKREDVYHFKFEAISSGTATLLSKAKVTVEPWTSGQIAFTDKTNKAAIYSVKGEDFGEIDDDEKKNLHAVLVGGNHPKIKEPKRSTGTGLFFDAPSSPKFVPNKHYTIGWVRFTVFGQDIWIDEVQSDLFKILKTETMGRWKDIQDAILLDFLKRMRRRGAERFYMPTFDMKKDKGMYDANPPMSVYRDLPKKMRFHMGTIHDVHPKVDGQQAWILESR